MDTQAQPPSRAAVLGNQLLFLLTGIFDTVGRQLVKYNGAGEKSTLLLTLPTYLGMLCVALLPSFRAAYEADKNLWSRVDSRKIIGATLLDVTANVFSMVGLVLAGSGIFQVVYSSVVLFSAILAYFILKRRLIREQWASLSLITVGLAFSARGGGGEDAVTVIFGIFVTLCGTFMYALNYVVNDMLLSKGPKIPSQRLCVWTGSFCTLYCLSYMSIYTFPNWRELVIDNMNASGGSAAMTFFLYILLILSAFGHNVAFFYLLANTGAVSTGVLQALRAVCVFAISSLLFCNVQSSQCYSFNKGVSTFLVVSGVLAYSLYTERARAAAAAAAAAAASPTLSPAAEPTLLKDFDTAVDSDSDDSAGMLSRSSSRGPRVPALHTARSREMQPMTD